MMAKDPARRFQTPGEVAQALTPFFKKGNAAFKSPKADVSQAGQTNVGRPVPEAAATPTQPATDAGNVAVRATKAVDPTAIESRWESLLEFRKEASSIDAAPGAEPTRRPPWMWPSVAVGVLMFGLFAAWMGGVFKVKTPDGVIVLENVPKDAEVFVDGTKITLSWPGSGKPLEIRAVPGQRKIEVKKDGFATFAKELTVKADGSEEITVRLEPLDVDRPGKQEEHAADATVTERNERPDRLPPRPVNDDGGTSGFVTLLNGKDRAGWKTNPKQPGDWHVENGILIGSGPQASWLYSERGDYSDFHLRVEASINDGGNSGICFRTPFGQAPTGYEAQINSTHPDPKTGSIYRKPGGPVVKVDHSPVPPDRWFWLEVIAEGSHIVVKVNGSTTGDYRDENPFLTGGHIALQQHNPRTSVQFRKIEIKELNGTAGGSGGLPSGPAQTVGGGPPSPIAAAPLKPAEKIWLQITKRVHIDEFNIPRTGLPSDVNVPYDPNHGRSDGVFFVYSGLWNIHGFRSDGTCEVVARVLSDNPRKTAAWVVGVTNQKADGRGFLIKINVKGELFLEPSPWSKAFRQVDPRIGPITHSAIKPGNEFNKLLLVMRKHEIVIFVNGVQVCDPVRFEYDVTPSVLAFGAAGPGKKRAEFDRVEIREMVEPENAPKR